MSPAKIKLKAKVPGLLIEIRSKESPYSQAWDYSTCSCRAISLCAAQILFSREEGCFPFPMGGGGEDCRIRERERETGGGEGVSRDGAVTHQAGSFTWMSALAIPYKT